MKYLPVLGIAILIGIFSLPSHAFAAQAACEGNQLITPTTAPGDFAKHPGAAYGCISSSANGAISAQYYDSNWQELPGDSFNGATNTELNKDKVVVDTTCDWYHGYTFAGCIWNPLLAWSGSWFLSFGAWLLQFAGYIFDGLVNSVIIGFGDTLKTYNLVDPTNSAKGIVAVGWTALRDLANIAIIGIFVYIALRIIVVGRDYGDRRLIARVLIVAVLINFSLLFTKLIIDGSNFVAYEIYASATQSSTGSGNSQFNLSQQFLKPLGITSVFHDTGTLANNVLKKSQSGTISFLFGLFGGLLLAALALVILYGAFLIATRAIVFIILMITAPLAFATYLWPSFAEGEYGWSGWWKSLINNAIFAPLLMLFVSITIGVVNSIRSSGQSIDFGGALSKMYGSQSAAVTSSSVSGILMPLVMYTFAVGLLFASFRISHSIAGAASGFNMSFANMIRMPLAAGALGSRFLGAPIARKFMNPRAAGRAETREMAGREAAGEAARARVSAQTHLDAGNKGLAKFASTYAAQKEKEAGKNMIKAAQARQASMSTRNPMDTHTGQALARAAGLSGFLAGQTPGGQKGHIERIQKKAEEASRIAAPALTKEQVANIAKEAGEGVEKSREGQLADLKKALKEHQENRPDVGENKETIEKEAHGVTSPPANQTIGAINAQAASDSSRMRKEIERAEAVRKEAERNKEQQKEMDDIRRNASEQSRFDQNKERIGSAQRTAAGAAFLSRIEEHGIPPTKATEAVASLEHAKKERELVQQIADFEADTMKLKREAAQKAVAAAHETRDEIVRSVAKGIGGSSASADLAVDLSKTRIRSSIVQSQPPIVQEVHEQKEPHANTNVPPRRAA